MWYLGYQLVVWNSYYGDCVFPPVTRRSAVCLFNIPQKCIYTNNTSHTLGLAAVLLVLVMAVYI